MYYNIVQICSFIFCVKNTNYMYFFFINIFECVKTKLIWKLGIYVKSIAFL